jgi:hypothetical protein
MQVQIKVAEGLLLHLLYTRLTARAAVETEQV